MTKFKKTMKKIGRQIWELVKAAFPATLMYCCAGTVLMMLTMKDTEALQWDGTKLTWTLVCGIAAMAYNGFLGFAQGGSGYEMLVSGNIKRTAVDEFGEGFKMSSLKEAKEYRDWKGFAIGGVISLFTIIVGIIFGCNQTAIDGKTLSGGMGIVVIVCFLLSGWSVLPFYFINLTPGMHVSYFVSCAFAILPILVTGILYIVGAYARRNKAIREQELADKAAKAESEKVKKINYGGLPGTKPKKRK